jgi:hypothetical protein
MAITLKHVFDSSPPWLVRSDAAMPMLIRSIAECGGRLSTVVRSLDGRAMNTVAGVFKEFSEALEFPEYFGYNSAAFDECMADLSWLPAGVYVLVIADAEHVLADELSELPWLIASLRNVCHEWSEPVAEGEAWDRKAKPFHVIFCYSPGAFDRLRREIALLPKVL